MSRNPKIFTTGTLVELGFRTEEGLPFTPNRLIRRLIENVLARAQTMYPVRIVNYVVLPNHAHVLVVVRDPQDVPRFVEYFKRETAYYVNALLGRIKHTVWCGGYYSPVILDPKTALERLAYISLNPVSAALINKAANYPLSSTHWANPVNNVTEIQVRRIPRNKVPKLPRRDLTLKEIDDACSKLEYSGSEIYTLKIEPNAWMDCFSETIKRNPSELRELLNMNIAREEARITKENGNQFPSLEQLQTQNIRKEHQPTKFGKRMLCLGKDKETRLIYLEWYYGYCKSLPRFLRRLGEKIYKAHYPPGFFAPGGYLSANILKEHTPFNLIA